MRLHLKHIGKIQEAEIDLNHQLTVFFGPNNSGKTYVSYCLYGLHRLLPFGNLIDDAEKFVDINLDELFEKGSMKVDLKKLFLHQREALKRKYIEGFRKFLPQLFGNYETNFSKSSVSLSVFENDDDFENYLLKTPFRLGGRGLPNGKTYHFMRESNGVLNISLPSNFNFDFNQGYNKDQIKEILRRDLLQYTFNSDIDSDIFFIPAERIGISVFGKELVLNRFSKTNLPNKNNDFISYSLVINDSIQRQFQMANVKVRKENAVYLALADEIENEILDGKLSINETGDVFYDIGDSNLLSILNSASTIKSLSSLVFYLRYFSNRGQVLIIDEPEINLHPDNQRKLAKLLAKLSKHGIKVVVSTHSDYIIREFNNLIMLDKKSTQASNLMEKYGYKEDETIDKNKVGVYLFGNGHAKKIAITDTGFGAETIDEVISTQNQAMNEIRWTLFDEEV